MARSHLSRTPLSSQASALRVSLLVSLGLSPLACGGTVVNTFTGEGGSSSQAGASSPAGAPGGGARSFGGYAGGVAIAGAYPTHAGAPSYAGGGTTGDGGTTGGAGYTGGASPVLECQNPMLDPKTQLITCSNGLRHRAQATACNYTNPPPPAEGGAGGAGGAG
ncbi:MAG TPA: hypothetical protein VFK05_02255, partial [Polyangiaceae bacterium]|nr:hypothetical protein [Polyangiaceae bacterium]